MNSSLAKFNKGNSNFELGTAICYVNVENYFLTIKYKAYCCTELKVTIPLLPYKEFPLYEPFHDSSEDPSYCIQQDNICIDTSIVSDEQL